MGVRHSYVVSGLFLAALVMGATEAQATTPVAGTVGAMLQDVVAAFSTVPKILSAFSYIAGLVLALTAIYKFKDHVENPAQSPLSAAVKRFIAGGMFMSLPFMGTALQNTIYGTGGININNTTHHNGAALVAGGMDKMIYDLITNIATPMGTILSAFTYISAILFLLSGISRLTKTAQEGPRGPAGIGTLFTFLVSAVLFSIGDMMGRFTGSLFGRLDVTTYVNIDPTIIADPASNLQLSVVIESLMTFIMMVGMISFIRGWFVLKAFADGGGNATVAQALTFLFGGALAINMGQLVNVFGKTIGLTGVTFS